MATQHRGVVQNSLRVIRADFIMQLLTYYQTTDYDRIRFRAIPYEVEGEKYVTVVEEKMKAEHVVADLRRAMPESMFMSLREAVLSVEVQ